MRISTEEMCHVTTRASWRRTFDRALAWRDQRPAREAGRDNQRNPKAIESAIAQALLMNPATESFQIQARAEPDGSVRLSGSVDSRAQRQLAERVASTVVGVTSIDNDVQVGDGEE